MASSSSSNVGIAFTLILLPKSSNREQRPRWTRRTQQCTSGFSSNTALSCGINCFNMCNDVVLQLRIFGSHAATRGLSSKSLQDLHQHWFYTRHWSAFAPSKATRGKHFDSGTLTQRIGTSRIESLEPNPPPNLASKRRSARLSDKSNIAASLQQGLSPSQRG